MKHLCRLALPLLLCAAPVGAQPAPADAAGLPAAAAVSAQQPTLPLSIDLLPYGTVVLTEGPSHGNYYIPNFQNTGVAIYVQSPRPLRVATLDEMVRAQAEWTRATLGLGRAAPSSATRAPVSSPGTDTPQARQTTSPGQAAPGAVAPAGAAQPSAGTRVPDYLRPTFRGRSGTGTYTITYSIMNTSRADSVSLEPGRLRLTQGGQPLPAQFSMRDSGGSDSGVLMPRSALIGTVTVRARSQDPIVLNWTARDAQGRDYPIVYTWQPR